MASEKLPEIIIVDILSRLPVKSLLRFRCVCKFWCALITDDPTFIKMHLSQAHASNGNLNIFCISPYNLYSVDLDAWEQQEVVELGPPPGKSSPYIATVGGSCNGLLCIFYDDKDIFLWNPSTRRHQKLPIAPIVYPSGSYDHRVNNYGFGYDPTTDDYKLVRVLHFENDDDDYPCDVRVYSLRTNSWRRIRDIPFQLSYHRGGFGIHANSTIYWIAERNTGSDDTKLGDFVVAFDLKDEEYREISLPEFDFADCKSQMDIGVLGGQFCVIRKSGSVRVELWVMKEHSVSDSWVKQFSIEQPFCWFVCPVCYTKNGEVIFNDDLEGLLLYDPREGRHRELRIQGVPDGGMQTYISVGSLVTLNAKDGTEQAEKEEKEQEMEEKRTETETQMQGTGVCPTSINVPSKRYDDASMENAELRVEVARLKEDFNSLRAELADASRENAELRAKVARLK